VLLGVIAALMLFIVAASLWVLVTAAVPLEHVERVPYGVGAGCGGVNGVTFCRSSDNVGGDGRRQRGGYREQRCWGAATPVVS